MTLTIIAVLKNRIAKTTGCIMALSIAVLFSLSGRSEEAPLANDEQFFTLENEVDLRSITGARAGNLLTRIKGRGNRFKERQKARYCELKDNPELIQWVLNDLETGEVISQSANADTLYFGASVSKLFVAAALLDKQGGRFEKTQLEKLIRMIVVSDNNAWKELQRQVGDDGSNDSGREAVDEFVQRMGYADIKAFQGWLKKQDGARIHGNELNARQLSNFLRDTYQRKYQGAEVLWKIMHATRTGSRKIDKYTPSDIFIGGKTGTYHGPNVSPETIEHSSIKAQNHAAVLNVYGKHYGLSILTNTGSNEDVAILGGGLMREYLGVDEKIECP